MLAASMTLPAWMSRPAYADEAADEVAEAEAPEAAADEGVATEAPKPAKAPESKAAPARIDRSSDDGDRIGSEPEARYGIGVRLRYVSIPTEALDIFFERTAGGATHPGFGVEFTREKGSTVVALGIEYENIAPKDGIYIEKGDEIPQDPVDYVEFDDFKWVSADISIIWNPYIIDDVLAFRLGAGLGVGYIMGDMLQTDYVCTGPDVSSCMRDPQGELDRTPSEDVPPVFPIVNVFTGFQLRPFSHLAINVEGGVRTVPFVGTTVSLIF
ncbi:hypothetical protein [Haliangium sp.]|uniref:hypothetical protein n=1 Tax=Haliangium sp. TaxID=2663208 RepID=UPI003D145C8E